MVKKSILPSFTFSLVVIFTFQLLFVQQSFASSSKGYSACRYAKEWPWEKFVSRYKGDNDLLRIKKITESNGEVFLFPDPILVDYAACDLGLNKIGQLAYRVPDPEVDLIISLPTFINLLGYNLYADNGPTLSDIPKKPRSWQISGHTHKEKFLNIGGGKGFLKFDRDYSKVNGRESVGQSACGYVIFKYSDERDIVLNYGDRIVIEISYREKSNTGIIKYSLNSVESMLAKFVKSFAAYSEKLLNDVAKPKKKKNYWQITLVCSHPDFRSKQNIIGETYMPSSISITGIVKDENGKPIPGAIVKIMELKVSAVTNKNGEYKISVPTKGEKPFSLSGFNFVLQKKITSVGIEASIGEKFIPFPFRDGIKQKIPIEIKVVDQDLKPLKKGSVSLEIIDSEKLPFISIEKDSGFLNGKGKYSTFILTRKPEENRDYVFLKDVPLKLAFRIRVEDEEGNFLGDKKLTFPLGMALLHGWTVGPDMKPRYEPDPPVVYPKTYYLASQASPEGEFYILVRIPSSTERKAKEIYLKWTDACHLPLELLLKKPLKAGEKIEVRKGKVDILTPEEHERRIKQWVREFLQAMGFDNGCLSKTLSNLQKLPVRYNVSGATVPHYARGGFESVGHIDIFDSDTEYWGTKAFKGVDPPYTILFHEMGHFVHKQMVDKWIEACLWDKFYLGAEHSTWRPPEAKTEKGKRITSFYENTADFFAYLMYKFLDKHHPEFKDSIYYDPGYLEDFDTTKKAMAALAYGGCRVEGIQTTFLRCLYGNFVKTSPARVFGDYLRTMDSFKQESWILRWVPARNIGEWVQMKRKYKGMQGGNLRLLAKKFRIRECDTGITAYAQGNLKVKINQNSCQLKEGVDGIVSLTPGDTVQVKEGASIIHINDPKKGERSYLFVKKGAAFQFLSFREIKVIQGKVAFHGPIIIQTASATIQPEGTSGVVQVKANGEIRVQVVEGKVDIKTSITQKKLLEGQEAIIDINGKIKSVQSVNKNQIVESFYQSALPAGVRVTESAKVSQTAKGEVTSFKKNWKWSDPEGNDHYSIQEGEFYLKINPYQNIWSCNRGGAGLLTTDVPQTDTWSAEVMLRIAKRKQATHTGLVIWNGREKNPVYALYVGLYDTQRVRVEGSYSKTCTGWPATLKTIKGNKGNFDDLYNKTSVFLKIERKGDNYSFYYRSPDSKNWKMLGQVLTKDKFTRIGFIGKSWGGNSLEARFTDFKLSVHKVSKAPPEKAPSVPAKLNIIRLYPTADSHVFAYSYRNWNNANWGKWGIIGAGWQVPGGEKRAYLKFDLPKVPVKRAILKLYLYNIGGSNTATLGVYRVLEPWNEGTDTYHPGKVERTAKEGEITWNNQPAFDPHPVVTFKPPAEINRWVFVDITPLVRMWLSGKPNYGLMIKMVETPHAGLSESIYNFWSREYKDKTKWPLLEIETSYPGKVHPPAVVVHANVMLVEKQSKLDYAQRSEKLRGDGHPDAHFQLILNAPGKTIKWLEIRNTNGQLSVWDTKPNNGVWLIVVVYDGIVLNHSDGSFEAILPEGKRTFDLYLQDNGSIAAGNTSYKLTVGFGNGRTHSFPIIRKP